MAPSRSDKKGTRKAADTVECPDCGSAINKMGLGRHRGSETCRKASAKRRDGGVQDRRRDPGFSELIESYTESNSLERLQAGPAATAGTSSMSGARTYNKDHAYIQTAHQQDFDSSTAVDHDLEDISNIVHDNNVAHTGGFSPDDIKVEYHPRSKKKEKIFAFEDYRPEIPSDKSAPPDEYEPWKPFKSWLDFELAEFMLDAHLNEKQSARLISLINQCIANPDAFSFKNNEELKDRWAHARKIKATGFTTTSVHVPYKDEEITFDVSFRPLWEWCLDLLQNPSLSGQFKWDAERHYKYDGESEEWVRFIDEPWTADAWWDAQARLPDGAHPLALILYADKTRLSSFGTTKGYPVMAHCANLPIGMRNGNGLGGSRVVGFLPVIAEDPGESGKKGYINFKRVVWHKSFYEIIKSLESHSKTGFWFKDGNEERWIFPIILILSADYEEQCVMALIRGVNSHYPCPICLVPGISERYELRETNGTEQIYAEANEMNATEGDKLLKSYGLRDIENVFWKIQGTDVHHALSFDRLHNNHSGFFSDHLWVAYKDIIDGLGKPTASLVDKQVNQVPPWSGLTHFTGGIMKAAGEFADGSKYEDMSKVLIHATEDILNPETSEQGYQLLQLMRSYLELDMYTSLTVHTDKTLKAAEKELVVFSKILQEYSETYPDKNWNFPKAHAFRHVFDDIRNKGVTRNYNTKPFEKAHALLKLFYQLHTNFKNVIPQLIKLNEADLACQIIRAAIDNLDEYIKNSASNDTADSQTVIGTHHVSLGSPEPLISFETVEKDNSTDVAFHNFRRRLAKCLTGQLQCMVRLDQFSQITPYKYLKVNYESLISWKEETNILRINPDYHKRPRYDFVLIQVDAALKTYIFAQLLYVFGIHVEGEIHYMALILPLDEAIPISEGHHANDKTLRLTRIRSRKRSDAVFVNVESIIRGGLVVPAFREGEQMDEHLVLDVIDEDMWWRMKSVKLAKNTKL